MSMTTSLYCKLQHEPDHARKAIGELTVITVGYHRRITTFDHFSFFYCFYFDFQKTVFFEEKQSYKKGSQSYNYTS